MTSSRQAGYLYGLVAYLGWGLVPLYFHALKEVSGKEILAHRIVWSIGLMLALTFAFGMGNTLVKALRSPRILATMLLSGSLLAANWYLYILAVQTQRVMEAGLGYYMMPLVNSFLAMLFLGEKLRPAHWPALAIIALGVSIPFAVRQDFTWLAVVLPITFGCYGLVRKVARVDSFTGLTIETLLLCVPSSIYIGLNHATEGAHFGTDITISLLLMFGAIVTVVPLLTYILALKRLPLLALNFIQFISPTMQMILGYYVLPDENLTWDRFAAIICVWIAVIIFIVDAVFASRGRFGEASLNAALQADDVAQADVYDHADRS